MLEFLKPWKWDRLQALSRQGVVKATIIMPVVGYLILFNARLQTDLQLSETFVYSADSFSVARLYFLYFGLAAMGVASLWFQLRCPPVIKAHGSAYEFINQEERAASKFHMEKMLEWVIRHDHERSLCALDLTAEAAVQIARSHYTDVAIAGHMFPQFTVPRPTPQEPSPDALDYAMENDPDSFKRLSEFFQHIVPEIETYDEGRSEVMNVYLVRQKTFHPFHRASITYLYIASFLLLAVPTIEVFVKVVIQVIRSFLMWIGVELGAIE